ncbi:MAG: 16S rRNA (cytosine(1402)-N(4))-methyltransferase RsmH [Deltaproteobacteria bacterium]|nr:16S rRNA (cytosine(1402)-N(4))-methyltransferase RsmH [Deltaproteobacteria bacterium]
MSEYRHTTVLKDEVTDLLGVTSGKVYFDATLGGGGHSRATLEKGGIVIATDMDEDAIRNADGLKSEYRERFFPVKGNFRDAVKIVRQTGFERVDGVVADLGLSSHQIENDSRGFSFMRDGPLDMRFDRSAPNTAYQFLKGIDAESLAYGLRYFADIKKAEKIAQYIKVYFSGNMPDNTIIFSEYLSRCRYLRGSKRINPATRVFMAIRMMVNDEVGNLTEFLVKLPLMMNYHSTAAVISFHSAEDRIVKDIFRKFTRQKYIEAGDKLFRARLINKKVIVPKRDEIRMNPRSRSARLRAISFTQAEKEE